NSEWWRVYERCVVTCLHLRRLKVFSLVARESQLGSPGLCLTPLRHHNLALALRLTPYFTATIVTTKFAITLNSSDDWEPWIELAKSHATAQRIWEYVNPENPQRVYLS